MANLKMSRNSSTVQLWTGKLAIDFFFCTVFCTRLQTCLLLWSWTFQDEGSWRLTHFIAGLKWRNSKFRHSCWLHFRTMEAAAGVCLIWVAVNKNSNNLITKLMLCCFWLFKFQIPWPVRQTIMLSHCWSTVPIWGKLELMFPFSLPPSKWPHLTTHQQLNVQEIYRIYCTV